MKLLATVAGAQHEVPASSLTDLVAFERHFGISSAALSPDEGDAKPRVEWIAFVIYRGLQRINVIAKGVSFEDALDLIEDFDMEEDEEDAQSVDPTEAKSDLEPAVS